MTFWDNFVLASAIGLGVYVVGQLIVFRQIEAVDYWEARGYINGLIRGSGDYSTAVANLDSWRAWWMERAWWKGLVENLYNYGLKRATEFYG